MGGAEEDLKTDEISHIIRREPGRGIDKTLRTKTGSVLDLRKSFTGGTIHIFQTSVTLLSFAEPLRLIGQAVTTHGYKSLEWFWSQQ